MQLITVTKFDHLSMGTYLWRYNHLYVYSEGTAGVLVYLRSFTRPKAVLQKFNLYPAQKRVPGPETGLSTQNHYLAVHLIPEHTLFYARMLLPF